MVVHDWERQEYKTLLNHFTVVKLVHHNYCSYYLIIIILKGRPCVMVALEFCQGHCGA